MVEVLLERVKGRISPVVYGEVQMEPLFVFFSLSLHRSTVSTPTVCFYYKFKNE